MNQIRQQRDTQRARVNERLRERRDREDRQTPRHGTDTSTGAKNRTIDQPVRVAVPIRLVLVLDEARNRLGLVVMLVRTKNRAVRGAQMAHPSKLTKSRIVR